MATQLQGDPSQQSGLASTLAVGGAAVALWAFALILMQCVGWMKHAIWQPLPLGAMFITANGQAWLMKFEGTGQALNIVPAFGLAPDIETLSSNIAGSMAGLRLALAWLLDTPLSAWGFAVTFALLHISLKVLELSAPKRRPAKNL
jgi:hypothetical protein